MIGPELRPINVRLDRRGKSFELDFLTDLDSIYCSTSYEGALRGLHIQRNRPQKKLIHVVQGSIFDVVVDLRPGSPTFGKVQEFVLSDSYPYQLYIPAGFAHGFMTTTHRSVVCYQISGEYVKEDEVSIRWNDPDLAIAWPSLTPILSDKDANGITMNEYLKP